MMKGRIRVSFYALQRSCNKNKRTKYRFPGERHLLGAHNHLITLHDLSFDFRLREILEKKKSRCVTHEH